MMTYFFIEFAYGRDLGEFGFTNLKTESGRRQHRAGSGEEGYDIDAKVDDSAAERFGEDCGLAFFHGRCGYRSQMILMLQSLLADRFKLKVHSETKQGSVYALVLAKAAQSSRPLHHLIPPQ